MVSEIAVSEYNPYYATYIKKATHSNIPDGLEISKQGFVAFVEALPNDTLGYAYADGKWTVAEVLLHIIDTERIFAYRALRFARNDQSPLMGFDQDEYVPNSFANTYTKEDLIEDFIAVRNNSISMFKRFTDDMLSMIGEASDSPMSTRAAGYVMIGHQEHHFEVLKERYL